MVVLGSACRAAIWTSRGATPASSMVVTKVCRSMCGCIRGSVTPACSASRRSRRVAQCRSLPVPGGVNKIGPVVRSSMDRSRARLTAGGSGTRTTLSPFPDPEHPVAVFFAEVVDVGSGGLEDPQPEQPEHGDQGGVVTVGRGPGAGEEGFELEVGQSQG